MSVSAPACSGSPWRTPSSSSRTAVAAALLSFTPFSLERVSGTSCQPFSRPSRAGCAVRPPVTHRERPRAAGPATGKLVSVQTDYARAQHRVVQEPLGPNTWPSARYGASQTGPECTHGSFCHACTAHNSDGALFAGGCQLGRQNVRRLDPAQDRAVVSPLQCWI